MSEEQPYAPDHAEDPAPGAEHGETSVDRDADTSHGTGSAPEHVPDEDLEDG